MRKGGIDCMFCMFGAPYPDCCSKDCGTKETCKDCTWPNRSRSDKVKEKENQEDGKEKKMD